MLLAQIKQFHNIGGYKLWIQTQKSKHNVKHPLYIDFIIIIIITNFIIIIIIIITNIIIIIIIKELMRKTISLVFSVTTMVLFKHTVTTAK